MSYTREGEIMGRAFDPSATDRKRYDVYKWISWEDESVVPPTGVPTYYCLGTVGTNGEGTIHEVRALVSEAVGANAITFDIFRGAQGTGLAAAIVAGSILSAAISIGAAVAANTWVTQAGFAAGGTRVAAGDTLWVEVDVTAVPTLCNCPIVEVLVKPDN